jgi:elongation factor G
MDRMGANFENDLASIKEKLTQNAVAINVPVGAEENFSGVIDLMTMKKINFEGEHGEKLVPVEIPAELKEYADKYRHELLEKIVAEDETLMNKYLEGQEISVDELKTTLRKATIGYRLVPVMCGTAFKNKGVQCMLDAVVEYLPSPLDLPPTMGTDPKTGEEIQRLPKESEPFSALVFKVANDPFAGTLNYFRVYSGKLTKGSYIYNSTKGQQERISRLIRMFSNKREEIDDVKAGDIIATVGMKYTGTGDTLCDETNPIVLETITFPEPVISLRLEPKTKTDQEKLGLALRKLAEEDPTFKVKTDEETNDTVISGMGELHLDVLVDRLRREFNVEANTGKPQVAYKETIRSTAEAEGKYIRQSGGKGQYGHV